LQLSFHWAQKVSRGLEKQMDAAVRPNVGIELDRANEENTIHSINFSPAWFRNDFEFVEYDLKAKNPTTGRFPGEGWRGTGRNFGDSGGLHPTQGWFGFGGQRGAAKPRPMSFFL